MRFGSFIAACTARLSRARSYRPRGGWKRIFILLAGAFVALVIVLLLAYAHFFGPADASGTSREFVVEPDTPIYTVTRELREQGFIKSSTAFYLAYESVAHGRSLVEGGYTLSPGMDAWTIGKTLASPPYLVWITFPPGWRKEQIADLLQEKLGWSAEEKAHWLAVDTAVSADSVEGVYFGDTYLIAADQPPATVAARLRGRFEDATADQAALAAKEGIPWKTVLTLASLVEREASKQDRALVAGIMWNRIHAHMGLQIDATLQYLVGNSDNWWPVPNVEDKKIDSLFNTYKYAGLPPHPIATPSIQSIDAVLTPEKTSCIYYLHDHDGTIHCSATYAGQLRNVNTYLK